MVCGSPSFGVRATHSRNQCLFFQCEGYSSVFKTALHFKSAPVMFYIPCKTFSGSQDASNKIQTWSKVRKMLFIGIFTFSVSTVQTLSITGTAGKVSKS